MVLSGFLPLQAAWGTVDPMPATSQLCDLEHMAKPLCATVSHLRNRTSSAYQQGLGTGPVLSARKPVGSGSVLAALPEACGEQNTHEFQPHYALFSSLPGGVAQALQERGRGQLLSSVH